MSLNRHATQRDANEPEVFAFARAHGYSVYPLDRPADAIVGKGQRTHLVEIKQPAGPRGGVAHRKLTKTQEDFFATWRGCYHLVRSGEELVEQLRRCEGRRVDA